MKDYLEVIKTIEKKDHYDKTDLFREDLLYGKDKKLEVYYAPFDYINPNAKVMLLGITPGWTQMHNAYNDFIHHINHLNIEECFRRVKKVGSFSGSIRRNLVTMLDEIKLNDYLKISSCATLFEEDNDLVQNASILRYPVFINSLNYTGSQPKMLKNELLMKMVYELFIPELNQLSDHILIIPMGKAVSETLMYLKNKGLIKQNNILDQFPHPSGANGSRLKQFALYKESFIDTIKGLRD